MWQWGFLREGSQLGDATVGEFGLFGSRILGLSLGFYSFPGNYFSFETPCNFNLTKMAVLYFSVFKVNSNHKFKINQFTFVLFVTIICFFNHIFCDTTCNGLPCQNGICKQNDTVCECFEGWSGPSCTHCSGRIRLESLDNYSEISVNSRSRSSSLPLRHCPPYLPLCQLRHVDRAVMIQIRASSSIFVFTIPTLIAGSLSTGGQLYKNR